MMNSVMLDPKTIQEIADRGRKIYEEVKAKYEPAKDGKFLAIDIETKELFEGNSSAEVLKIAKDKYPKKVFYVVKIGESSVETIAQHKHK